MNKLPLIKFRPATQLDREDLLEWRNHETVRQFAKDPSEISMETHTAWLTSVLADPQRILLIGETEDGEPIGVLRYDVTGRHAMVSIYVVPDKMGQGYGSRLLLSGNRWLLKNRGDISQIFADLLPENAASIRTFEKGGYRKVESTSQRQGDSEVRREILRYEYNLR